MAQQLIASRIAVVAAFPSDTRAYNASFHSVLPSLPFPGYPSGHAKMACVMAELYSHFFPADKFYFQKRAKVGAASRFQAFHLCKEPTLDKS